jgi:hypothetical protein
MIERRSPFGPGELPADEGAPELAASLAMGRELETFTSEATPPLPATFVDDVMAAIALEPAPRPVVAAGRALRLGRPLALLAAVRDAWRVGSGTGRPAVVRAPALALVLVAVVALGSILSIGGYAVGSALGVFGGPEPVVPVPTPSPSPSPSPRPSPSPSPSVSPSLSPTVSPSVSPSPSPSATATGTDETETETETPEFGDDSGGSGSGSGSGNSGPGSDNSGRGSDDASP